MKAGAGSNTGRAGPRRRWWRYAAAGLAVLGLLMVGARLALPSYLQSYVNRTLDQSPEYDGRVGEIDVHLWRGAYTIRDLDIVKTTNAVPVPFFEGERVDFSLDWGSLLRGRARGKIVMERPRLNFVHGASAEETQTGADQPWLGMIEELYPFRIDKAEVREGAIHFRAFHKEPQVDVYLSDVQGTLTNLTNAQDSLDPLIATVEATGTAMESGEFEFQMRLDPKSYRPTFSLATRLVNLDVTQLSELARAYGEFDFEGGEFDLVVELTSEEGQLDGYAKPLFRDVTVLSLRDLENDNPLQVFWEGLVGVVGEVFQNQARDQFGTRITITGVADDPKTSILEIIGNVLRNAFVRAYLPTVEGKVSPAVVSGSRDEEDR